MSLEEGEAVGEVKAFTGEAAGVADDEVDAVLSPADDRVEL